MRRLAKNFLKLLDKYKKHAIVYSVDREMGIINFPMERIMEKNQIIEKLNEMKNQFNESIAELISAKFAENYNSLRDCSDDTRHVEASIDKDMTITLGFKGDAVTTNMVRTVVRGQVFVSAFNTAYGEAYNEVLTSDNDKWNEYINLYGQVEDYVEMAKEQIKMEHGDANDDEELEDMLSRIAYENIESQNKSNQRFVPNQDVVVKLNGVEQAEKLPWTYNMWGGGGWG